MEELELRLCRRVPGTTNVVRILEGPVRRRSPSSAFLWISYTLFRHEAQELVVSSTSVSTKQTVWYELGKVIVTDRHEGFVRKSPVEVPPCFVYDGPENLTKADLPPGVAVKEHLMEKVVFEARLDGGDHILVEMREADLLHKAYMIAKATKEVM